MRAKKHKERDRRSYDQHEGRIHLELVHQGHREAPKDGERDHAPDSVAPGRVGLSQGSSADANEPCSAAGDQGRRALRRCNEREDEHQEAVDQQQSLQLIHAEKATSKGRSKSGSLMRGCAPLAEMSHPKPREMAEHQAAQLGVLLEGFAAFVAFGEVLQNPLRVVFIEVVLDQRVQQVADIGTRLLSLIGLG